MNKAMKYLMAAAVATLTAAGCSSASHPAAAPARTASSSAAPSSAAPSPSPSVSQPPARLTMRQARTAYTKAVDPYNRALDVVSEDYTDRVPLAQFHRDLRAEIAALRALDARLAAIRWPAHVAPYIHALLTTDAVADLRCARDVLKARSYDQAETTSNSSQGCTEAQNGNNADTIRSLLHLPSAES